MKEIDILSELWIFWWRAIRTILAAILFIHFY